ncbi:MAG: hypothetical protein KAS32_22815 [Candidatus Peribacteraceae bacterium]|nr:hypothetical protein [Candidatus Peribacteraceae bacterium]
MNNAEEFVSKDECIKEFKNAGCTSKTIPPVMICACFERDGGLSRNQLDILLRAFAPPKEINST